MGLQNFVTKTMMSVICAIMFASVAFVSSKSFMCPESIPTVSIVSRCPANAMEWKSAAERKKCDFLGKIQNCTQAENFVYHCVLNKETTELVELCAPVWFMAGYCARFSEVNKRIINDPGLDCTTFDTPCPSRFPSNESYKYQTCYRRISNNKFVSQQRMSVDCNTSIPSAFAVSFGIIFALLFLLFLLFFVGIKLKWIKFTILCLKKNDIEKQTEDQNEAVEAHLLKANEEKIEGDEITPEAENTCQKAEDRTQFRIRNLSGDMEVNCYLTEVKTISDLRELLSAKIKKPKQILLIVDKEEGIIFNDDTEIEPRNVLRSVMMIGNQDRTGEDDATEVVDVISNSLTGRKCKMSCGHWTDPNTLFDWTKEKLPGALTEGLPCPRCWTIWDIDELIQRCKMSPDERLFFKSVESIINRNAELAKSRSYCIPV